MKQLLIQCNVKQFNNLRLEYALWPTPIGVTSLPACYYELFFYKFITCSMMTNSAVLLFIKLNIKYHVIYTNKQISEAGKEVGCIYRQSYQINKTQCNISDSIRAINKANLAVLINRLSVH